MTDALERWNDERLDDLAAQVKRNGERIDKFLEMREAMTRLQGHVENAEAIATRALAELTAMKEKAERRDKDQHDERKADRRWMVGTILVTAGLVLAAVRLFLGG